MGNEFGHPEWIDFPREGNGWSFHYCRRQWNLLENGYLKYQWLGDFDRDMIHLAKEHEIFKQKMADQLLLKDPEKVLCFYRNGLVFVFNFHPSQSLTNVLVPFWDDSDFELVMSSDDVKYGGQGLVEHMKYESKVFDEKNFVELYIPARTAMVFKVVPKPVKEEVKKAEKKAPAKKAAAKKKAEK